MKRLFIVISILAVFGMISDRPVFPQSLADYTAYPPFVKDASAPPIVMFVMSRDHKLFYKAYNDIMDLDEDGTIDSTYKDTINYYGYFDSNKCYTYSTSNGRFEPTALATGANSHYCTGAWSGNFLNWTTMARMDIIRKVLYGGHRSVDTSNTTVLSRVKLPRDGHSWAKVYNGADIASLIPWSWSSVTLCNLNTSGTESSSLIYVVNGYFPYAASTEGKQCVNQFQGGPSLVPDYTYNSDVLVCVSSMLDPNCLTYQAGTSAPSYKPAGLLQNYGVDRKGTTDPADDTIQMKFGLLSGSYAANVTGGVLRSNIVDLDSEVDNTNGMFKSNSNILKNLDRFKVIQYNYSTGWYDIGGTEGSCVPSEPATLTNGVCKSWGNPIGEMLYETIRYFQGQSAATPEFHPSNPDKGISSLTAESTWTDPYTNCPYCSKPFALILSDASPSYDSDHLPGSYWPATIGTSDTPSVQTLTSNANMDTLESIGNVFVGQSAATFDRLCSSKAGNFFSIRGLCVEEPTKQGAFYTAGLAHYARTTDLRPSLQGDQKMITYAVATATPVPNLEFDVGGSKAQVIPIFHDGCPSASYPGCTSQGDGGDNSKGQLVDFQLCQSDADWTGEQGNGFTSCYDILWDDAEYGWDYELDIRYRIYVKTAAGSITVKTKGLYAAAGHTDYAGYAIRGVTGAGEYYEIKCGGGAGFSDCDRFDGNETPENTRTFSVTGSNTGFLKDPLWYAAKYGGFDDKNGNNQPDLTSEWDKDGDGNPDTYFFAANPLKLEDKLTEALLSILNRAASGTSVSVLASSSTGEGSVYQAYFFPKVIEGSREINWTGYTHSLFLDPLGNLREDTNGDGKLVYTDDKIVKMRFDDASGQTLVDRFDDSDGDGQADSTTPFETITLREIPALWEAGEKLALKTASSRKLLTWTDIDGDGLVDIGEQIKFDNGNGGTNNTATLAPFLRADASGTFTATNIIDFIRGVQVSGMRDRQLTVNGSLKVWKMGDPIYANPVVVGPPQERYDVIYGDQTYADFFRQYKDRRRMVFVGGNDGMLHGFNGGFYHRGDDPNTTTAVEHGYFTKTPTDNSSGPELGDELWGFIPQELLPHLRWLTRTDYTHVYYVDLRPKITDARIFTPDADHPGGWGTILIGGFRMGGSCSACVSGSGAPAMTVTADFNGDTINETRTFYSAYFVLDITNPEKDPKLLWSFSHADLGLTTSVPTVIRANPGSSGKTDNTNAKWFMIVGSGPTGYGASSSQVSRVFAIELANGPGVANLNVTTFSTANASSFMGDLISVDANLDYRVDVIYGGNVKSTGTSPAWSGTLYRLTTSTISPFGEETTPTLWGYAQAPTVLISEFACSPSPTCSGPNDVGPIPAAPTVTLDDSSKLWVFFGNGRFYDDADKTNTDTQYFFGVKDPVLTNGCTQTSVTSCERKDLVNVSSATVCVVCSGDQVTGVGSVTTFEGSGTTSLIGLVQSKEGWYTTLPSTGERTLSRPTLIGGTIFFTTLVPDSDICKVTGDGYLYALFYLTGTANKESVIGTETVGSDVNVKRSTSLGTGLPSEMAIHIGGQGSGTEGSSSGSGCAGRITGFVQTSTGALSQVCGKPALSSWSRYVSWLNKRL